MNNNIWSSFYQYTQCIEHYINNIYCCSSKKKNHGSKKRTGMSVLKEDDDEDDNTGGISIKASSNTNKGFLIVD